MKKAAIYAATLVLGAWGTAFAQTSVARNLDNAVHTAENIPQDVQNASNAIDALVAELTVIGNPDANAFHDQLFVLVNNIQNNADDIDWFVGLAKNESTIAFSTAGVNGLTTHLVELNDNVIGLTGDIADAVTDHRTNDAIALIPQLRSVIAQQSETADAIVDEIASIRNATTVYTVVIQTVDYNGNPVNGSDLHGFWAQNTATGTYSYADQENVFYLPAGTYLFDSFDGYFSGTGSATVTLSDALVNQNGEIVVNLVYWSE